MKNKIAQQSVEFMIIFIFILVFVALAVGLVGVNLLEVSQNTEKKEMDDLMKSLQTEIDIYYKSGGAYNRKYEIPKHIVENYNVTIKDNLIIYQDLAIGSEQKYYYEIQGRIDPILYEDESSGETEYYILFEKLSSSFEGDEDAKVLLE
jgi:hypothetical protein